MAEIAEQILGGRVTLGEITSQEDLERNLSQNAVPANLADVTAGQYPEFLAQRRRLMADVIRSYYDGL